MTSSSPLVGSEPEYRALVARRVKLARTRLGLTQDEVGAKVGERRNYVSDVERARMGLDPWRLGLLADALEVPFGWLLSRSAEPLRVAPPRAPDEDRNDLRRTR